MFDEFLSFVMPDTAVFVPNRQRIIRHKPLREHLLVTLAGLARFGKVVGEVAANQLLPWNACFSVGVDSIAGCLILIAIFFPPFF